MTVRSADDPFDARRADRLGCFLRVEEQKKRRSDGSSQNRQRGANNGIAIDWSIGLCVFKLVADYNVDIKVAVRAI